MRYTEFKVLQESQAVYVIGDSHAKAMGGTNNLASNGARLRAISGQARRVPRGSTVYMTGGHNDVTAGLSPARIALQLREIIATLEDKDCTVNYILFPEGTDNNNQDNMSPTRDAIKRMLTNLQDLDGCSLQSDGIHCSLNSYRGIVQGASSDDTLSLIADLAGDDPSDSEIAPDLEAGPPYPNADKPRVREMQTKLYELGYDIGRTGIDGMYGPRTTRAVGAYKDDYNISTPPNVMTQPELDELLSKEPSAVTRSDRQRRSARIPEYPPSMTRRRMEDIIRDESDLRGIDPDVAIAIFRSEGAGSYQSQIRRSGRGTHEGREASFGPFQLFTGGGLGNEYEQETGRELVRDNTDDGIENQIRFSLDKAIQLSWQPWYGRRVAGVGRREGLQGARPRNNWA